MNATIKDIARLSGVGISTVSRVLNGSGSASKETKEKVMEAVRELNYVPNGNARNLKMRQTSKVMVLVKSIENPFLQKIMHEIENLILLRGYTMDIRNVSNFEDEMKIAKEECTKDLETYLDKGIELSIKESGNKDNQIEDAITFYPIKGVLQSLSSKIQEYYLENPS